MLRPCGVGRWFVSGLVLVLGGLAPAWAGVWQSIGPGGGLFNGPPVVAPGRPRTAFVAATSGAYRTDDGGLSWRFLVAPPTAPARVLAVDPNDAETVFGVAEVDHRSRLVRSEDGGAHWLPCGTGLPQDGNGHVAVVGVAFSARSGTLFAATPDGLFVSVDRGASWKISGFAGSAVLDVSAGPAGRLWVAAQAFSPDDVSFNRVSWSGDDGATWQPSDWPADRQFEFGTRFRFDPAQPARPYVVAGWATAPAYHRGAAGWSPVSPPGGVFDLLPLGRGLLLASTAGGRMQSGDDGLTWRFQGRPLLTWLTSTGGREILAFGENGAWRSTDGGARFRAASQGLNAHSLSVLAAGPAGALWTGAQGVGLFRSRDGGASWQRAQRGLGIDPHAYPPMVWDLAIAPNDPGTAYAVLATDVVHVRFVTTRDGGAHWSERSLPPYGGGLFANMVVAVDPLVPERVYWVTLTGVGFGSRLWRSDDAGGSWTALAGFSASTWAIDFAIDPDRPHRMLALEVTGLLRSTDGGRTFARAGAGLPGILGNGRQLAIDPERPAHVFVAGESAAYESDDFGGTFHRLGPLPLSGDLSVAVAAGGELLVASREGGVRRWSSVARAFVPVGGRVPFSIFLPRIVVDPETRRSVYALSGDRSVWRFDLER